MYDTDNIFAKIIRNEVPVQKVYEDDQMIAIHDQNPIAPIHILIMPKGEYCSFDDFVQKAPPKQITHFFQTIQKIASDNDLPSSGYRIIANHGSDASQTIPHFHVHLIGKRKLGAMASG